MGGRGLGAHMHVDNVKLSSWQAQLKGTKEWVLAPPPECYYVCQQFSAVVQTGDISRSNYCNKTHCFNNNSNIFSCFGYKQMVHKTNVLSKEISITIGAEYD